MNAGFEYREEIGKEAAGRTVLAWLARRYRHTTEAAWRERIASGEVRLDGSVALAMDVLRPGQTLVWRRPPWEEPVVPLGFAILHRDEHLLAVAKPRGLPSVPNGGFLEHTLLVEVVHQPPRGSHVLGFHSAPQADRCARSLRRDRARRPGTGRHEPVLRPLE